MPTPPLLATHSGTFHLDDAFAYAVLRLAVGLREAGTDHRLLRSRDAAALAKADILWDVGTVHDPATQRFDHHQIDAPTRPDGKRYSAAGLVWQVHGAAAVRAALGDDPTHADAIAAGLDAELVRRIDEIDNGEGPPADSLSLSRAVEDLNPPWDRPADQAAEDAAFIEASALCEAFLRRRIASSRARLAAESEVRAAHAISSDPRLLELARKMPWQEAARPLPVLLAVYPVPNGNWMVDTLPTEPGGFTPRLPLPAAWAGLRDDNLAAASGVPDAVFVHVKRFVGAARSRQGALAMARHALAINPS